jgi:hypothetical protein
LETGGDDHQPVVGQVKFSQNIKSLLEGVREPGEAIVGEDECCETWAKVVQRQLLSLVKKIV